MKRMFWILVLGTLLGCASEQTASQSSDATIDTISDVFADASDAADAPDRTDVAAMTTRSCPDPSEHGCAWVCVPGGTFRLGSEFPPDRAAGSTLRFTIDPFCVNAYEVTVLRFRRFWLAADAEPIPGTPIAYPDGRMIRWSWMLAEPDNRDTRFNWSSRPSPRDFFPLNGVNWATALAFCRWDGGRLPTTAEWEFLARRHLEASESGRVYPWGPDRPNNQLCLNGSTTCRVGSYPATAGGIFDLGGNVWEWLADNHRSEWDELGALPFNDTCWRIDASLRNPLCLIPDAGSRSVRGGGYQSTREPDLTFRTTAQRGYPEMATASDVGFRCVYAAPPP